MQREELGLKNGGIERVILYDRHDTLGACTKKPASGKLSYLSAIDWPVFRWCFRKTWCKRLESYFSEGNVKLVAIPEDRRVT
jgi:hypothetical protein